MINIVELKQRAKEQVEGNYWNVVLAVLIHGIVLSAFSQTGLSMLLVGPLGIGMIYYLSEVIDKKRNNFELLIEGFKVEVVNSLIAGLLLTVFITLWSLLLLIPGIVKGLSYSMTLYILKDNPTMNSMAAIKQSESMMKGHKMELFNLILSFIGWFILGLFTLGLALVYIAPVIEVSILNFYRELKANLED